VQVRDDYANLLLTDATVQYALVFLPGLVGGRLFDIGYFRIPFVGASILLVLATFLVGECTEYWHFLLCQGFAVGVRHAIHHYKA